LQYTRLDRDHARYGLYALFFGECNIAVICGKTSGNLFVIDCETKESFKQNIAELRKRSIPLWAAESARGGHLYLRCPEGEVANIDHGTIPNIEIKGCRRYVLAPPSLHPSGTTYQWIAQEGEQPPSVELAEIDWLTDANGPKITLKLDQPRSRKRSAQQHEPYSPLSRSTQDYLENGHTTPTGNRNSRLFRAACDLAGNQRSYHEAYTRLAPIAQRSGLNENEIRNTVQSAYSKHREPSRPHPNADARGNQLRKTSNWQYALAFTQQHEWTGRTGNSDRTTMLALVERARYDNTTHGTFRASVRELSTIARLGTNTIQKTLKRLQTENIIKHTGYDTTSGAALWSFTEDTLHKGRELKNDTSFPPPYWSNIDVSFFNSADAVERGALGCAGLLVYRLLVSFGVPVMPKVVAASSRLRVHQVNYALRKLSAFGIVRRVSEGWLALPLTDAELDEVVARAAGTLGRGQVRQARYARDRCVYVGRLLLLARLRREGWKMWHSLQVLLGFAASESNILASFPSSMLKFGLQVSESYRFVGRNLLRFWRCPNCGQFYFADDPPDMCDFCHDFTTWQECSVESVPVEGLGDDPVCALALELGAVISVVELAGGSG
jgi:hypothetical protein